MADLLDQLYNLIEDRGLKTYLVGGVVRDLFLNRKINDYDFVLEKDIEEISRQFADLIGGNLVKLDQKRGIYRIIKSNKIFDFNKMKGNNIRQDLADRDFTINSLALTFNKSTLSEIKKGNTEAFNDHNGFSPTMKRFIIDPFGGIKDLKQKKVKLVKNNAVAEDPLRILRGIRFKAALSFTIEPNTEKIMQNNVEKLNQAAEERIKDELLKIFSGCNLHKNIKYMEEKMGLLSYLIPEVSGLHEVGQCKYHKEDVWTHSLYLLQILEEIRKKDVFSDYINAEEISLLRWSGLFHDIGKLETEKTEGGKTHFRGHAKVGAKIMAHKMKGLKFSNKAVNYVKTLIRYHMRPLSLYSEEKVSKRAYYRFFNAAGNLTPAVCVLSAADVVSTRELNGKPEKGKKYLKYIKQILKKYDQMECNTITPYLNGEEIMEILNLSEGPAVGKVLEELKEAQALGRVNSRSEAKEYVKELNIDIKKISRNFN